MTAFAEPPRGVERPERPAEPSRDGGRPSRWALSNWPVRWKVVGIFLVPLLLAGVFGGLRIQAGWTESDDLRLAADRAQMVPPIEKFIGTLQEVLLTNSAGGASEAALTNFDASKRDLQARLDATDAVPDVRAGVNVMLDQGQSLLDQVTANGIDLRGRVTAFAPILLTAEDAVNGSVRVDDGNLRAQTDGLSRAIGARGQMTMQRLLLNLGAELPEPELRTSMTTLAGTEPSTLFGMAQVLGVGSPDAQRLQQEMVKRMALMSDPAVVLVDNPELSQSLQATEDIANKIIDSTTSSVTTAVEDRANTTRSTAIRDTVVVGVAILLALAIVLIVARTLVRPLRILRDGALRVAHEDLARELERVRTGGAPGPVQLIPVNTTEEVGQVAHAVDELHEQAVFLAGEQARLQLQLGDMFETLSRRSRSLVDQQLGVIDRLERDEEDPERLQSLFKLDHLAARMRRNGANLLVLAGSKVPRDEADPIAVGALVNAAASEVEDYARVITTSVPDSEVHGVVAGDLVHVLAELLDNALRYSPPSSQVRVSAVHTGNGGLVIEVGDDGLGMTDADLRVSNTRLQSGGEVNPYTARHMGLFVVGRLAAQHGLVVRMRSTVAGEPNSGTTAGVFIPAELLLHGPGPDLSAPPHAEPAPFVDVVEPARFDRDPVEVQTPEVEDEPNYSDGHADIPISLLPQRNPGASGIAGIPSAPLEPVRRPVEPQRQQDDWPPDPTPVPSASYERPVPTDTSSFFAATAPATSPPQEPGETGGSIFDKMLSEWLIDDPTELAKSTDLDWQTVWDHGWSAAAAAEQAPVEQRTDAGLPVRQPGARLIPGAAESGIDGGRNGTHRGPDRVEYDPDDESTFDTGPIPVLRDPEAVRTSIGNHFGGVHAGRSHAREARGTDAE